MVYLFVYGIAYEITDFSNWIGIYIKSIKRVKKKKIIKALEL